MTHGFLPDTPRDSSLLTIPCSNSTWSKFKSCWLFFYSRYLNIYFSWRVINQRVSPKYLWNRVWKVNFPLFHCPWIALTRAERSLRRDKEAAKKGKEGERNGLGWKGKKKYPRKTRKKRKKCHVKLEDGKGESNSPSLQRFSFFFLRPVHRIINLKFESSILTNYIDLLLSPFSGFLALNNVIILFLFFFQR